MRGRGGLIKRMRAKYKKYGRNTPQLESKLLPKEKKVLGEFLKVVSMNAAEDKVNQHKRYILQFRDVVEKPITKITRKIAVEFWGLVNISEHELNTKVMIRRAVKRFLKWHYKNLEMLEGLKVGSAKVNVKKINKANLLKPKEIELMLRKADSLRDKAFFITLYETGGRPQEVRDLRWRDINFDEKEVHLFSSKKHEDRDLPIEHSIVHLKRWRQEWAFSNVEEEDYVFPSQKREKHLTTEQISKIVKKLAKRSGIVRNVTAYLVRHTRLNEIYHKGVKGLEHNKFAGHTEGSRSQTTYVRMDNSDMKQDVLKKVYNIKEVSEGEKDRLKELEKKMAKQQKEAVSILRNISKLITLNTQPLTKKQKIEGYRELSKEKGIISMLAKYNLA